MEPRAHHILIGLFTVLAVASALLFALWLGKSGSERHYHYYEILFDRAVSGLAEGNAVQYSGVKVGDVMEMRLDPADPRRVRVLVRVGSTVPIKEDTRASLVLANISGSMNIQLHGGSPESPPLRGHGDALPFILADPSPLSTLLSESENLALEIGQLLHSANQLLSEENVQQLGRILGNVEQLSAALAGQHEEIAQTIGHIHRSSVQAEQALTSLARLGEQGNALLDQQGRALISSTQQTMHSLSAVTTQLEGLLSSHDGSLEQGLQSIGELPYAMRELRESLRTLNRIGQRLEDNPAAFLRGHQPIQEFTP